MRKLVYGMMASLDGYIEDPGGNIDWTVIDEELHRFVNQRDQAYGAYLYGRRLYENMAAYWPTAEDDPANLDYVLEYARIWKGMPKVVFSHTLNHVGENTRLVRGDAIEEVMRLKEQPGGDLCIGGATIAASMLKAGLVDECHLYIHPVILGGGKPLFPRMEPSIPLKLVEMHPFHSGVVYCRYQKRS